MEHEEGAFQIRPTLQRLSSLLRKYRRLFHGPWSHQNPQPVPIRKSITAITKDKPNNTANRNFPPQSQSFSTEIQLPSVIFSQA